MPRVGAGWTSAVLVQGGRSCETALPTLAAVCGRTRGPGAKGRASPVLCLGFTSSPGSLLRAGRAADAWGGVSSHPTEHRQTCCREHPLLSISLGHGGSHSLNLPQEDLSPSSFTTLWVPAGLISIFTCFPVGFTAGPAGTASFCSFARCWWSWLRVLKGWRKAQQM